MFEPVDKWKEYLAAFQVSGVIPGWRLGEGGTLGTPKVLNGEAPSWGSNP